MGRKAARPAILRDPKRCLDATELRSKHRELAVLRVRINLGSGRCRFEREEVAVRPQHALQQRYQRLGQLGAVARALLLDCERMRAQRWGRGGCKEGVERETREKKKMDY